MDLRVAGDIRVLHIDDEASFLEMTAEMLSSRDEAITVTTETDPEQGLERLAAEPFDCLVLDYDMPEMDGIELVERVREEHAELPVVLFTGHGSEAVASDAISAGVTDYIRKTGDPDRFDLLANRIRNAVEGRRAATNYREIFEKTADGIVLHDPETGEILDANEQYCQMNGYRREELIGATPSDVTAEVAGCSGEEYRTLITAAVEEGPQEFEWYTATKADEAYPVEVRLKHTRIGGRAVVLASVRDVTERKESQRRLEAIIQNTEQPIYLKDRDGVYQLINPAGAEVIGRPVEEIVGRTDEGLWDPEDTERILEIDRTVLETGEPVTNVGEVRTEEGTRVLQNEKFPYFDEHGEVRGVIGISEDVTEQRRREAELTEQRDRIAALHDVAIDMESCDTTEAVFAALIAAAEDILKFDIAAVDGRDGDSLVPKAVSSGVPDDGIYSETAIDAEDNLAAQAYRSGESSLIDDIRDHGVDPADTEYRAALSVPIGDHGVFQAVSKEPGAFDEFDRELAELLASHAANRLVQLENEAELQRQATALRRHNERLEEFASIVSHDLRGPLNVAMGELELARDDEDFANLDNVAGALERMDALIESSLTLVRQGRRVGELEPVDLASLSERCWRTIEAKGATLNVCNPPTIEADPDRVRNLLENLFRNAVEHGLEAEGRPAGSDSSHEASSAEQTVTVSVGSLDSATGFYVEDDGPGIPVADAETVFEPGFSSAADGTGMGLAIVKWIADAHGWDLHLTASSAGGARFEFSDIETP